MADQELQGRIVGIKPRGNPKNGVQTFWTLEVQTDPNAQYPARVSFNSHDQDMTPKPEMDTAWDALKTGRLVTLGYYEKPNDKYPDKPFKNGTFIAYVEGSDGGGSVPNGSSGSTSPAAAGTPPPSGTYSEIDWGAPPQDTWSTPQVSPTNVTYTKDETTKQIEAAWAVQTAIALLGDKALETPADELHTVAHQLLVMKYRIAQEIE